MVILFNYALLMLIPYLIDIEMELTQRRHLRESGYDYSVKKYPIEIILREFKRYMSYFIPAINIFNVIELLDGKYHRFSKNDIGKMLKRGEIKPVGELTKIEEESIEDNKNLFLKVIATKESAANLIQREELSKKSLISQANIISMLSRSDSSNKSQTFSELTTDQKIEILLKELELLYEQKAEEMGIDLEKEIDRYREELKSDNNSEEISKKLR